MKRPRDFLGRGWSFPVHRDPQTGRIAMSEHGDDVKESIRIILGTSKGERVMRPDFGCGIHELVFESLDATTLGLVQSSVREALVEFEPRIQVLDVEASTARVSDGVLEVAIDYRLRDANRRDNVVFPFYLEGNS